MYTLGQTIYDVTTIDGDYLRVEGTERIHLPSGTRFCWELRLINATAGERGGEFVMRLRDGKYAGEYVYTLQHKEH